MSAFQEAFMDPKKKDLIDREASIYRRETFSAIEREASERRLDVRESLLEVKSKNVKAMGESEHEYHQGKQDKMVVLAKLDAEIEFKKDLIAKADLIPELEQKLTQAKRDTAEEKGRADGNEIVTKDLREELARTSAFVEKLLAKLPNVDLKDLGITLNADIAVNGTKKEKTD